MEINLLEGMSETFCELVFVCSITIQVAIETNSVQGCQVV